jgi:uncharacterized OB-fold protein
MSAVTRDETLSTLPVFDEALVGRSSESSAPWLIGWRCARCGRLAFGRKRTCPVCGSRSGQLSRIEGPAELETWTTVYPKEGSRYSVGYCLAGDGQDEQRVRVFGPIVVADENELRIGQTMSIGFAHSHLDGREACHHAFYPDPPEAGR